MSKASSLFVLVAFMALATQVKAQVGPNYNPPRPGHHNPSSSSSSSQNEVVSERVQQSLRLSEQRRIAELLRISSSLAREMEVISLTISASSSRGQASLSLSSFGRPLVAPQILRRQLTDLRIQVPSMTQLEDIEISASDEIFIDSITAEVRQSGQSFPRPGQIMQPLSGQMLKLELNQQIRGSADISLKQLVKQQLGLALEGSQIDRIVIQGASMRGMSASVQVEMNNRILGQARTISQASQNTPIPLNTIEEVQGSLRLLVRGDVLIQQISIRVGQVRPVQQAPMSQRIQVSQEISSARPLELSRLMPYESRLVSSLSIEARVSRQAQAEIALVSFGQILASTIVSQVPMRPVLRLIRPVPVRDLKLQSLSSVIIDAIEVSF